MAIQILPILKMLGKSSSFAETVNLLIKQFNKLRPAEGTGTKGIDSPDIRRALEVQAALNEKMENQVTLLQDSVSRLSRNIKSMIILIIISLVISAAALVLGIINIIS